MITLIKNYLKTSKAHQDFNQLSENYHKLVIYSEGAQDWPHIGPMVEEFFKLNSTECVSYLSSGENDPGLSFKHERFKGFYIGSGTTRTLFFKSLKAKILLMSLPDLNVYELKRSVYPVHYVYCFHSINSVHTVYRDRAFEFFDTIFCVGPHHLSELKKEEEIKGLKPRVLISHGSIKLDTVIKNYSHLRENFKPKDKPLILLAPSWGIGSFAEDEVLIKAMITEILKNNYECRLRLHPMTVRHHPNLKSKLKSEFTSELFQVEDNLNDNTSLRDASIMISDWSGAATEFAFGLERPVIFINTPQKINNPHWKKYEMAGLEDFIRNEIGVVVETDNVGSLPAKIQELIQNSHRYKSKIQHARDKWIYHVGQSAEVGAKYFKDLLVSLMN